MLLYVSISVLVPLLCHHLLHVSTFISSNCIISSPPWIKSCRHWHYPPCKHVKKWIWWAFHYWLVCLYWCSFKLYPPVLRGPFFAYPNFVSNQLWRRSRERNKVISKCHQFNKIFSVQNPHSKLDGNCIRLLWMYFVMDQISFVAIMIAFHFWWCWYYCQSKEDIMSLLYTKYSVEGRNVAAR